MCIQYIFHSKNIDTRVVIILLLWSTNYVPITHILVFFKYNMLILQILYKIRNCSIKVKTLFFILLS